MKNTVKKIMSEMGAELTEYHSGGGFYHYFYHLKDGRFLIHHLEFNDFEISFSAWDNWESYVDAQDQENGFGYESRFPDYDKRTFTIIDVTLVTEEETRIDIESLINWNK
jgi:hypothetical protein